MFLSIFQFHFPLGWLYSQANFLLLVTRRFIFRLYHTISAADPPAKGIFNSKRSRKGCHLPGLGHTPFPEPVSVVREIKCSQWPGLSQQTTHQPWEQVSPIVPMWWRVAVPKGTSCILFIIRTWRINPTEGKMYLRRGVRRKYLFLLYIIKLTSS